jgi:zona occludens toxin (predicted ATPase)
MAIKGVSGNPGSGKTYLLVHFLLKNHFTFDPTLFEYVPKSEKLLIVTNVEGLKLNSITFDQAAKEVGASSLYDLLRIPNIPNTSDDACAKQSKIWKLKELYNDAKILLVFDEFQRKFDTKYNDPEVLFFFQYHRHLGTDIYFMTQSWFSVNKKITDLCEYEYRALPRSFTVFNEFRYGVFCAFDKVGTIVLPMDKSLFRLYKSTQTEELKGKEIRPVRKFAMITVGVILCALVGVYYFLNGGFALAGAGAPPAAAPPTAKPSALPAAAPHAPPAASRSAAPLPDPVSYTLMYTGSFMVGDEIKAIQWNGKMYPAAAFPFQWSHLGNGQVQVFVPATETSYRLEPSPSQQPSF